ncbi:MAG: hypothetical protein MJB57_10510, partial [Gemmatimonadetes bacterium]|nr:hypothetical protein [Gemmatimonadota bacterium]
MSKLPRESGRFGLAMTRIVAVAALSLLVYAWLTHSSARSSFGQLLWAYGLPVAGLLVAIWMRLSGPVRRDGMALSLVATVFALYVAEAGVRTFDWVQERRQSAERKSCRSGLPFGGDGHAVSRQRADHCIAALQRGWEVDFRSSLDMLEDL